MYKNSNNVTSNIFRAYDIRGTVPEELNEISVYDIAVAFGSHMKYQGQNKVIVARDGRLSGEKLLAALISGLKDTGCDVINIGEVPTPVLYFAVKKIGEGNGIMLTGSHNPANYNGLKMLIKGKTLANEDIQFIKNKIINNEYVNGEGTQKNHNIKNTYIKYITDLEVIKKPLKIVIDAGNGVAGNTAPLLFKSLGCDVIELFCDIDGNFPNHHPDPSNPKNLIDLVQKVKKSKSDVGIAFDGDGDRIGVVTSKGEIVVADIQLMLYAQDILKENVGATIIYDVKCTKNINDFIKNLGGKPIMYKTGHAFIKNKIIETNAELAGEMSGHVFFNDRWFGFDDGLYTGVRLIKILADSDLTLDEMLEKLPKSINTPEINIAVTDENKFLIMKDLIANAKSYFSDAEIITIDGARVEFKNGWGLVRASNTTPNLVLRFEAETQKELEHIQKDFINWVNKFIKIYS